MRVVVLTSETAANVWLVNQLLARHNVVGIVIERRPLAQSPADRLERRRRLVRRYGWPRTLNKLLFNRLRSQFLDANHSMTVSESFFPKGASPTYSTTVPTLIVEDINAPECRRFVRELNADILAVCGTTVLKPATFTQTPKGAINIHTGITPEYRSADPIFWALYRGEPEKVGVTIHHIDAGIDTGAIIHQDTVPVYSDDSLATIYVRCVRRGAELYSRALTEIEQGSAVTMTRPGVTGRAFLSVDLGLIQYLVFRWRFRRLATRLPRTPTIRGMSTSEVRQ
jgi:folate-dependent phosphoribosylglycinamide formyltransferase PurN